MLQFAIFGDYIPKNRRFRLNWRLVTPNGPDPAPVEREDATKANHIRCV